MIVVLIVGDCELINMGTKSKEQVQFDNYFFLRDERRTCSEPHTLRVRFIKVDDLLFISWQGPLCTTLVWSRLNSAATSLALSDNETFGCRPQAGRQITGNSRAMLTSDQNNLTEWSIQLDTHTRTDSALLLTSYSYCFVCDCMCVNQKCSLAGWKVLRGIITASKMVLVHGGNYPELRASLPPLQVAVWMFHRQIISRTTRRGRVRLFGSLTGSEVTLIAIDWFTGHFLFLWRQLWKKVPY